MKKILFLLLTLSILSACGNDKDIPHFDSIVDDNKYQFDEIVKSYNIPAQSLTFNSVKDSILLFRYIQDGCFNMLVFKPKDKTYVSDADLQYIIKDEIENKKIHLGFGEYFDFSPTVATPVYFERKDDLLIASVFLLNNTYIYIPSMYNLYICNNGKTTKISEIITNKSDHINFEKTNNGYYLTCKLYGDSVYRYKYFDKSGDILRSTYREKPLDKNVNFITQDKAISIKAHSQIELSIYDLNNEDDDTHFLFEQVVNPQLSLKNFSSFVESKILIITYYLVNYDGDIKKIKHSINLDTKKIID